jgi:hypothetical protein
VVLALGLGWPRRRLVTRMTRKRRSATCEKKTRTTGFGDGILRKVFSKKV